MPARWCLRLTLAMLMALLCYRVGVGRGFSAGFMRWPPLSQLGWVGPTTHANWDEQWRATGLSTTLGVDQGCPMSPLLFAWGLAPALDEIAAQLQSIDGSAGVSAYLYDVVVVVSPEHAATAYALVERCLGPVG